MKYTSLSSSATYAELLHNKNIESLHKQSHLTLYHYLPRDKLTHVTLYTYPVQLTTREAWHPFTCCSSHSYTSVGEIFKTLVFLLYHQSVILFFSAGEIDKQARENEIEMKQVLPHC